jgi:hypothetical protein
MVHSIAASLGIFKNHVRWLLMLSDYYNGKINEVDFLKPDEVFPSDPSEKVDFLLHNVYPLERDCLNWLDYEWTFRENINQIMYIEHNIDTIKKIVVTTDEHRILGMYALPKQCMWGYMKFDPLLHNRSPIEFLVKMTKEQQELKRYVCKENEKLLLVDAFRLQKPVLDKEFYDSVVLFFDVDNQYEHANRLHERWYQLQQRAKTQAYNIMKSAIYPEFAWRGPMIHHKPTTQQQWIDCKNTILEIYKEDENA